MLEFLINSQSRFNKAIQYSFLSEIDAAGETPLYSFFFVWICHLWVTTGIIFSPHAHLFNHLLGPIWFPMICTLPELIIGFTLQRILTALRH